jgi:hypothetical protein
VDQSTLLAPFQQLIEAVSKTQHIFGTVIPISCGPQPVNVVYPVLFCLHFGLRSNAEYLMSIINAHVAVADEAKRRATPWNRVSNWATGAPAWAQISRGHYSEASYQFQRLEPLLAPSEQLGSLLQQEELLLF